MDQKNHRRRHLRRRGQLEEEGVSGAVEGQASGEYIFRKAQILPNQSSADDEPMAEAREALEGDSCNLYPTTCDSGLKCCITNISNWSGTCRNLHTDEQNCGQCGNKCGFNAVCSSGVCTCTYLSMTYCPGSGCHTLNQDENNCGACGNKCFALQVCLAGSCEDPP